MLRLYKVINYGQKNFTISPHILKILQNQPQKFKQCRIDIRKASQEVSEQTARTRTNLIFNLHCSNEVLSHLKPSLVKLICNNTIQSQYQLDQILKWLLKQIKVNSQINQNMIIDKINKKQQDIQFFQQQLTKIKNKCQFQKISYDLNQLCKQFRQKFYMLDSKTIFQKVKTTLSDLKLQKCQRQQNKLWDKLAQIKPRRLKQQCNTKQIYDQHLKITNNKPRFRFPPQPNGYLHIGHVKSIRINFQSAKKTGGSCYLRYDDTNPDKQTHQFIQQIQQNVKWLGYTPDKITFASDYFDQLLFYAHQLIKKDLAYVCDSSQAQIQHQRKNKQTNPYRNRTKQQNLKIFPHLAVNQTLRFKGDPAAPNPTLRDPIIYRRKQSAHPRTGNKYQIYPMYDFTHCISDSLQHIDYSLCSLQFQIRRQLYYKFLDVLGLYKPTVWQYSRLNVQGNVLSKRKIKKMIQDGVVSDWSDPRLLTIRGLRNRGYTSTMLINFIDKVNCSRSGNQNKIQHNLLQKQMKKQLLQKSYKSMGVLAPMLVIVDNIKVYIQKQEEQKLKIGQQLILKSWGIVHVQNKINNTFQMKIKGDSNISQMRKSNKLRIIHWIRQENSQVCKITAFNKLMLNDEQVNPQSMITYKQARIPKQIKDIKQQYFQFQRIGFLKRSKQGMIICTRL